MAGLLVLVTIDTALVGIRASGGPMFQYWLTGIAAASWVALVLAASAGALAYLGGQLMEPLRRALPRAACLLGGASWGALVGAMATVLLRPWDLDVDRYHLGLVVPVLFVGAGLVTALLWQRSSRPMLIAVCALVALACFAADALVLRRLYGGFHNVAALVAVIAAALGFARAGLRSSRVPLLIALAVLAQVILFANLRNARAIGVEHGTLQPKLLSLLHGLSDRDRDGYSPILGGGDCDDASAEVYPGRCEIPDNHRDDNCNGLVDGESEGGLDAEDELQAPGGTAAQRANEAPAIAKGIYPDIYIVLADAMRADMGRQAWQEGVPELAAIARQSLDFQSAYTPYPSTYRALLSTLQSRYWRQVGPEHPTLLRLLAQRGYDVQLWIAEQRRHEPSTGSGVIDADRRKGDPFHVPRSSHKADWTRAIIDDAIAEQGTPGGPRLRWLHILDTHAPCMRAQEADTPLRCYRREVRHVSAEIGRLWQHLQASERGRKAIVIVMADHGEEFADHAGAFHGSTLFEENTHVPFFMHLPGIDSEVRTMPVSLLDMAPTLLAYLGMPRPKGFMGLNLLAAHASSAARVLSQIDKLDNLGGMGLPELVMARQGSIKLIRNVSDNLSSLYDLAEDPTEQHELVEAKSAELASLQDAIARWQDAAGCRAH